MTNGGTPGTNGGTPGTNGGTPGTNGGTPGTNGGTPGTNGGTSLASLQEGFAPLTTLSAQVKNMNSVCLHSYFQ